MRDQFHIKEDLPNMLKCAFSARTRFIVRINTDKNYSVIARDICSLHLFIIACQRMKEQKRQRKCFCVPTDGWMWFYIMRLLSEMQNKSLSNEMTNLHITSKIINCFDGPFPRVWFQSIKNAKPILKHCFFLLKIQCYHVPKCCSFCPQIVNSTT